MKKTLKNSKRKKNTKKINKRFRSKKKGGVHSIDASRETRRNRQTIANEQKTKRLQEEKEEHEKEEKAKQLRSTQRKTIMKEKREREKQKAKEQKAKKNSYKSYYQSKIHSDQYQIPSEYAKIVERNLAAAERTEDPEMRKIFIQTANMWNQPTIPIQPHYPILYPPFPEDRPMLDAYGKLSPSNEIYISWLWDNYIKIPVQAAVEESLELSHSNSDSANLTQHNAHLAALAELNKINRQNILTETGIKKIPQQSIHYLERIINHIYGVGGRNNLLSTLIIYYSSHPEKINDKVRARLLALYDEPLQRENLNAEQIRFMEDNFGVAGPSS